MFGSNPRVNLLASRKELLIAESELNRAHIVGELGTLKAGVYTFAARAKSFGSVASSAAVLVAGLAAFKRSPAEDTGAGPSWFGNLLKGASVVSTLWLAFRRRSHKPETKPPNPRP